MSESYERVIPRDLFRESLLLKSLGRLCLMISDGMIPKLHCNHVDAGPFNIQVRPHDGGLECSNLEFFGPSGLEIQIFTGLARVNDRWPLLATFPNDEEIAVFDFNGNLNEEFQHALDALDHHFSELEQE